MYELVYLPMARADIDDCILYIADVLKAPQSALALLDALDKAILSLKQFPFSCRVYHSKLTMTYEYRMLPVKNYIVFYTVREEEKRVEIHRVLYGKRDLSTLI